MINAAKSTTSYKDTGLGIVPRSKIIQLEKEGVKKALEYIIFLSKDKTKITPSLVLHVHQVGFAHIFPK